MKNFILLSCLTVFVACTDFSSEVMDITHTKTIPIEEALSSLEDFLYTSEIKTKSVIDKISGYEVMVIGADELSINTKSNQVITLPDTLLYAVNFTDGGFALLSANTDLNESIICVTENGALSLDNFISANSFLISSEQAVSVTNSMESDELEDVICQDAGKDYLYSLLTSAAILDYYGTTNITYEDPKTKASTSVKVGPLLQTKWTQDEPFDLYKDPPGCAVIATAQIMAYNEKPVSYDFKTVSVSWATLRTLYPSSDINSYGYPGTEYQVAHLAQELGNSSNCDVNSTGGTTIEKVKDTFEKYGYDVTKKIGCANADIRRITQQIVDERKPVYMRGQMKDIVTGEQKGHAWVIDGVNGDMFHINWGWHGDSDGYYSKGVFNTADLMSYDSSDPGISNMSADFYHYFRYLLY